MIDPTVVPAVVAPVSQWTPATVGVLLGAVGTLATLLSGVAVKIIREVRSTKQTVVANAAAGVIAGTQRDQKLDRIEVLVDGRYSQVLQELATMKQLLADVTGKPVDKAQAVLAQANADEQHARVAAAGGPTVPASGSIPVTPQRKD